MQVNLECTSRNCANHSVSEHMYIYVYNLAFIKVSKLTQSYKNAKRKIVKFENFTIWRQTK